MEMREGLIVSGSVHAGFILWAVLGGLFNDTRDPDDTVQVAEVSMISAAEFDALVVSDAPDAADPIVAPVAPAPEAPAPEAPAVIAAPAPVQPNPQPPAPAQETVPDVAVLTPPVQTEVTPEPPTPPAPPPSDPDAARVSPTPTPRPAPRVAPTPAPAPPPEAEVAPVVQEAPTPQVAEDTQPVEEAPRATAPEEAATEIVTEAEQPSRAPETSSRPPRRPSRPAPAPAVAAEQPADTGALAGAIAGAIAEAQTTPAARAAPSGPPLTQGERDGLRVSVSNCWNVGSLSSEAMRTTITIALEMNQDGTPVASSLRMVDMKGESQAAVQQAFEAARRAIIRCGARGFDLPIEKYDQWREIEMTFNPETMRIR